MLKCLIVPLLVASITSAIGALDLSMSKKIALRYVWLFIQLEQIFFIISYSISDQSYSTSQPLSALSSWESFWSPQFDQVPVACPSQWKAQQPPDTY